MTQLDDGRFVCDKCGGDCGNGGVAQALVVSDLDVSVPRVVNLHFCRERIDDNGKKTSGCDKTVLSAANLAHYLKSRDKYARPSRIPAVITTPKKSSSTAKTGKRKTNE